MTDQKSKVQVWIHSPRKVLILKTNEKRGYFWQPVTGGVEEGEDLAAAALREASEETGARFGQPIVPLGYRFTFERKGRPIEETVFALGTDQEFDVRLDPAEHIEARWVSPEEALELVKFESNREGLRRLIAKSKESK